MVQKTATAWVVAFILLFCHAQASTATVTHFVFGMRGNANVDVCDNGDLRQFHTTPAGGLVFTSMGGGEFEIGLEGQVSCSRDGGGGENLIQNGAFDQGTCSEWELEDPNGRAAASCSNEGRVTVQSSGQYYEVQLKQSIPLINGQWYRLSFDGDSSVRHIIPVGIINPASYDSIGLWADCDLHTDRRSFEYLFRSSETISDARFSFYIGEHPATYRFDNVTIVPVDPSADCFRAPGELIVNGGFECDQVCQHAWRFEDHFGPGYALCDAVSHSGAHSAKLRPAQAGQYYETQYQQLVTVQQGQRYELRFYARTNRDPQTIVVELVDPQSFANRGLVFGPVLNSSWTEVRQSFTANRSGVARLGFAVGNWDPGTPVWIDDVSLRPVLSVGGGDAQSATPSALATQANAAVFALEQRADVRINVFDVGGRQIAGESRSLSAGTHTYIWDGLLHSGVRAPSGIYFVQVTGASVHAIKRIVMVR